MNINSSEGNLDNAFNVTSVSQLLLPFLISWLQATEARLILKVFCRFTNSTWKLIVFFILLFLFFLLL